MKCVDTICVIHVSYSFKQDLNEVVFFYLPHAAMFKLKGFIINVEIFAYNLYTIKRGMFLLKNQQFRRCKVYCLPVTCAPATGCKEA